MSNTPSFWRDEERALADAFVRDGYVIIPAESRADLDRIRDLMADIAASFLKLPRPEDKGAFLDHIHDKVDVQRLNDLRLAVVSLNSALFCQDDGDHERLLIGRRCLGPAIDVLDRLAAQGLSCNIASELEFFLFNGSFHEAFVANYRGLAPSSDYRIDYHTMQPTRDEAIFRAVRNWRARPLPAAAGEYGSAMKCARM